MRVKLLVAIVNYKRADLTLDCLRTAAPELRRLDGGGRIVVVDNGSDNGDAETLAAGVEQHGWSDVVEVTPSETNRGFAGGNNVAIRRGLASGPVDYVMLLNNDTLVREGAFAELVSFMDRTPDCGIAGARLEWPDAQPQVSAFNFPSAASEFADAACVGVIDSLLAGRLVSRPIPDEPTRCDWVSGAGCVIRSELFDRLGLLDEGFFMYFEEVLFNWFAAKSGWRTWYVPSARIVHLKGQTSGVTKVQSGGARPRPPYWFASRRRFFARSRGRGYALLADVARTLGSSLDAARRIILRRPPSHAPGTLRMVWMSRLRAQAR